MCSESVTPPPFAQSQLAAKERELREAKAALCSLREDFAYNLKLIEERDAELTQYDAVYSQASLTRLHYVSVTQYEPPRRPFEAYSAGASSPQAQAAAADLKQQLQDARNAIADAQAACRAERRVIMFLGWLCMLP